MKKFHSFFFIFYCQPAFFQNVKLTIKIHCLFCILHTTLYNIKTRSPAVVRFQEEAWQELLLQNY